MTLATSVYTYPVRTSPFDKDPLAEFRRDWHLKQPLTLRTSPFGSPPMADYMARVESDFEAAKGACTGQGLSMWA